MTNPAQALGAVSEALYGLWAPSLLARDLRVSERSVRRWKAGTHAMPDGMLFELWTLCIARASLLGKIADKLQPR